MTLGTVKWFDAEKGFGFIVLDVGGPDAFVHITAVQEAMMTTLFDGQRLSFDVKRGQQGKPSAVNLKAI